MNTSKNVGRLIIACDGYSDKEGQIIAEYQDRWGKWYMVAFEDGTIDEHVAQHSVKEKKCGIGYSFKN